MIQPPVHDGLGQAAMVSLTRVVLRAVVSEGGSLLRTMQRWRPAQNDLRCPILHFLPSCQLHFTWASRLVFPNGTDAWRFEKREYTKQQEVDEVRLDQGLGMLDVGMV